MHNNARLSGRREPKGAFPLIPFAVKGNEASFSEYYQLRGWDEEGIPTLGKLEELGLSEFADIVKEVKAK